MVPHYFQEGKMDEIEKTTSLKSDSYFKLIVIIVIIVTALLIFNSPPNSYSAETKTQHTKLLDDFLILSTYQTDGKTQSYQKFEWRVENKQIDDTEIQYEFSKNQLKSSNTIGVLTVAKKDKNIHYVGAGGPLKSVVPGILFSVESPVPFNLVFPEVLKDELDVQLSIQAGGRQFVKNYSITKQALTYEEAQQNGWIQDKPKGANGTLSLVTVLNDNDKPVLKQVWQQGDAWWVYEETQFRISRRFDH